jgi:adenine phosphoribosyltransferase
VDRLKKAIASIPGFPKQGIVFRDITPVLADLERLREAVQRMAKPFRRRRVDLVVGAEARGFLFGPAIALELGAGFVPVRKPGKLPRETRRATYDLEYGTDTLEMHRDAIPPGSRVLLVDDLLATGGTMKACCRLVEEAGGIIVACAFLVELTFLNGRQALAPHEVLSLVSYASEDEGMEAARPAPRRRASPASPRTKPKPKRK